MTRPTAEPRADRTERATSMGRRFACGAMTLAALGLVAAVLLGAPLISILLAGLLLLCPLLLWAPFRYQDRSLGSLHQARHGDD